MVVAGILIKVEAGKVKSVLEKLRKTKEVAYAYAVFGRFDVIATIKNAKDLDTVGRMSQKNRKTGRSQVDRDADSCQFINSCLI